MAEGHHGRAVGLGSQTFTIQWGHHRAFAMLHKAWCPLHAATFLPSLQLAQHISILQSQKPDVLADVSKINIARGTPAQSGILVGQNWSSKRYSSVSLLLTHSPRKTFIFMKLPNGFLSPHQFLAFSVFWDSCIRAMHCVRKFCFSFFLNRASAGFTLLQILWQD